MVVEAERRARSPSRGPCAAAGSAPEARKARRRRIRTSVRGSIGGPARSAPGSSPGERTRLDLRRGSGAGGIRWGAGKSVSSCQRACCAPRSILSAELDQLGRVTLLLRLQREHPVEHLRRSSGPMMHRRRRHAMHGGGRRGQSCSSTIVTCVPRPLVGAQPAAISRPERSGITQVDKAHIGPSTRRRGPPLVHRVESVVPSRRKPCPSARWVRRKMLTTPSVQFSPLQGEALPRSCHAFMTRLRFWVGISPCSPGRPSTAPGRPPRYRSWRPARSTTR